MGKYGLVLRLLCSLPANHAARHVTAALNLVRGRVPALNSTTVQQKEVAYCTGTTVNFCSSFTERLQSFLSSSHSHWTL
jgi:hypothetical protein